VEELGLDDPFVDLSGDIARELFDLAQEQMEVSEEIQNITCSNCGLSLKNFAENGKLGCPVCYNSFEEYLKTILRRYHGSNTHKIRSRKHFEQYPGMKKIIILEKKLNEALKKEDFEAAAALRDEIREMKNDKI